MRSVRTTTENNLIKIHFSMQELPQLKSVTKEVPAVQEEQLMDCEGGVCALNWSPTPAAKTSEAA